MTASLPVPNDIDPEEPDGHTSAPVVPITPAPAKKPRAPRKSGSKRTPPAASAKRPAASGTRPEASAEPDNPVESPPVAPVSDPGPPPPLPSDLAAVASVADKIVVPPKPPLPPSAASTTDVTDEGTETAQPPIVEEIETELEPETSYESAPSLAEPVTDAPAETSPSSEALVSEASASTEASPLDSLVPVTGAATAADALVLRGVTKRFGSTHAVDGIDLTVPAGTFYGLVGPNGAGKTTTLSMIAGLLEPDQGSISVGGIDAAAKPREAKSYMGVLPDRLRTFDRLTGRQLLYYYGVLRGLRPAVVESRTADLARAFDLSEALGRSVSDYSAGMLKKVMLAGALIHSPRLLVLDEPFESVDPVSSAIILDILSTYVAHGGTVILSSHGMELVERVCSRVAVIVAGQVLAEGTVDEVRGELTLEQRFVELAGGLSDVEGLEWLHTFSD